jgi:preprotein translocase subunit SecE
VFVRQVVAELRKVIWPTRQEMITYTTVSLVFIGIMVIFVTGLDTLLGKLVLAVFGGH